VTVQRLDPPEFCDVCGASVCEGHSWYQLCLGRSARWWLCSKECVAEAREDVG
jgi:hypothetical protein